MTKKAIVSDDPLIMKVRKLLKKVEPRQLPTETITNDWGHTGWKCPYCGAYCGRHDRTVYRYRHSQQETLIDYGGFNSHFGAMHADPFWKEKQLIALLKKELA